MSEEIKRGRGRPKKVKPANSFGPKGIKCSELLDIVYLRPENALYYSIHNVSPASEYKIRALVSNHILPFFEKYYVADLSIENVSSFRSYMEKKIRSRKYEADIYTYTKAAFSMVNDIDTSRIYRDPFSSKAIAPIRINSTQSRYAAFTFEDIKALFSKKWDNYLVQAFSLFCAYTGCRPNEVISLTPEDFNICDDYVEVTINKNWNVYLKANKDTKTEAGNRIVVLPRKVFDYLKNFMFWEKGKLCFSSDGETHLYYRYYTKFLNLAMKQNGVQDYEKRHLVMYSFRPFYKSYTSDKLSPELSNFVMGHAEKTIGDRYWHYQRELHAPILCKAVEEMGKILISN